MRTSQIIIILLCLVAMGIGLFNIRHYSAFTVDDAYISFRYAENFAKGLGLVFNQGEYVEGYTNFLWVILLGILKKIGFDVPAMSLLLGALFSLLTLAGTFLLSATISRTRHISELSTYFLTFSLFWLASSRSFAIWSVAGLETPLFMCVFTFAVWRHIYEEMRTARIPYSAALFGLMSLTRPEGIMYFGITLLHTIIYRLLFARKGIMNLWKRILIFSAFVLPHFVWRWSYYGKFFPNTYYIKVSGDLRLSGFKYVYEFFLLYGGAAFFLVCCFVLLATRVREYWTSYLLSIIGLSILYFVYVGGDWMPEFRFFAPILPFFFLCLQEGLRALPGLFLGKNTRWATVGVIMIMLTLLVNNGIHGYMNPPFDSRNDGHVEIGYILKEYASPDDVIAAIDIGAMAYISGLRMIDYFGLIDDHIAQLQPVEYFFEPGFWGHSSFRLKSDIDYVLRQTPRFIEMNTVNNPQDTHSAIPLDPYSALMLRHPNFQKHYVPLYHAGGTTIFTKK